ncbi:MAG TPA: nucleotide disphospho-sugar-binding domain-containing protein [Croceibacterium sp.]|nr:nucleotide disphospho-sugar-binding domain-containing protein [Croceibacterium sp.]
MAKFILTTWEGGGAVGPVVTVARKLVEAGHAVRVMSDACNRPESEAAGAKFVPWTRAPSRTDRSRESEILRDWDTDDVAESYSRVIGSLVAGPSQAYAEDVIEELERDPADLIVTSELLLGVMAGAEAKGVPFAMMPCNTLITTIKGAIDAGMLQFFEANPPTDPGIAMKVHALKSMQAAMAQGVPAMNQGRVAVGLPPVQHLFEQLAPAKKTLMAVSKVFEGAPEQDPAGVAFIGAQLDEPGWAEPWTSPWPADDKRPLVLVGFSTTFQNQIGVLQNVIDALGTLPVRGLVTLGPTVSPGELSAPDNVQVVPSAPHGAVMEQASLVITHGGFGTLARALTHKLPVLVMPMGRDQGLNAEKVMAHGAGLALPPDADPATIAGAAQKLLAEASYAEAAGRIGEAISAEMRESRVVEELVALSRADEGA